MFLSYRRSKSNADADAIDVILEISAVGRPRGCDDPLFDAALIARTQWINWLWSVAGRFKIEHEVTTGYHLRRPEIRKHLADLTGYDRIHTSEEAFDAAKMFPANDPLGEALMATGAALQYLQPA